MFNLKEHDLLNCVPWYMYHCIVMSSLLTELMFKGLIHILDIVLYVLRFEGEIKKRTIQRKYTFYHEAHSVHCIGYIRFMYQMCPSCILKLIFVVITCSYRINIKTSIAKFQVLIKCKQLINEYSNQDTCFVMYAK